MILIVDKLGNTIPAAAVRVAGGIAAVGDNAFEVSLGGLAIHDKDVTREVTVSGGVRIVSIAEASRAFTVTQERTATVMQGTNEVSRVVSGVGTVSAGAGERTVTRDISATRAVTQEVTREITVTNDVTGDRSKPYATVTDEVTTTREATIPAGLTISVAYYPYQTRGANFTFEVRYYKLTANDDYEEFAHTPTTALTVSVTESATGDTLNVSSIDTTGWANGAKDVTAAFTGGTGSGLQVVQITDPDLAISIEMEIAMDATETTKSPDQAYRYYASDTVIATQADDWDATAYALWDNLQDDILSAFDADTTLVSATASGLIAQHYIQEGGDYLYGEARVYGGYVRIPITAADKQNLIATGLRFQADLDSYFLDLYHVWSPYLSRFAMKVKFTESASSFASGGALRAMSSPDLNVSLSILKSMEIAEGGTPEFPVDVYLPFPKSVIENMTGNYLYAWVVIDQMQLVPYQSPYFRSTPTTTHDGWQSLTIRDVRVVLSK